jgi:ubiquitin-conjugating enzyme E2 J2
MASIIQKKRLVNEIKLLAQQPLHYCTAYPDKSNPLIWYFLIIGQNDTDYHGGEYIGKIVHSPKYPAEPPDYYMLTPSGRYKIGTKICLSNSSYHKGEWSSTWNILSILIAFYSIWLDDKEHGISHIKDTSENRKKMAMESIDYNNKNNADIYINFDKTNLKDNVPVILSKKIKEQENKEIQQDQVVQQQQDQIVQQQDQIVQQQEQVVQQQEQVVQQQEQVVQDQVVQQQEQVVQQQQVLNIELEQLNDIKKVKKVKKVINIIKHNL